MWDRKDDILLFARFSRVMVAIQSCSRDIGQRHVVGIDDFYLVNFSDLRFFSSFFQLASPPF